MKNRISVVLVILAINLSLPSLSFPQPENLGIFDRQNDIGKVNKPGSKTYDARNQEYTIKGFGANMWLDHDEFHFVWKRVRGDFILTTRAQFIGKGVEEHRKIGWIVRSSLDSDSAHVNAAVHGDGLTSLQFRRAKGGLTEEVRESLLSLQRGIGLERRPQMAHPVPPVRRTCWPI
jgi:TolB protein